MVGKFVHIASEKIFHYTVIETIVLLRRKCQNIFQIVINCQTCFKNDQEERYVYTRLRVSIFLIVSKYSFVHLWHFDVFAEFYEKIPPLSFSKIRILKFSQYVIFTSKTKSKGIFRKRSGKNYKLLSCPSLFFS